MRLYCGLLDVRKSQRMGGQNPRQRVIHPDTVCRSLPEDVSYRDSMGERDSILTKVESSG
jgi:hypothetical protein